MFGLIVSGRLVQTDFQQVTETQFLINIPEADKINHVVIFMTGQTPFPDELGGAVYFSWPRAEGPMWTLLGHISNAKPSAIFKISSLKPSSDDGNVSGNGPHFGDISQQQSHLAQIGISVEPLNQIVQQTPAHQAAAAQAVPAFSEFSTKMAESLFNYASSFAQTQSQMSLQPSEMFVPLSTLKKWYENFQRRLQQNPYFWKS